MKTAILGLAGYEGMKTAVKVLSGDYYDTGVSVIDKAAFEQIKMDWMLKLWIYCNRCSRRRRA